MGSANRVGRFHLNPVVIGFTACFVLVYVGLPLLSLIRRASGDGFSWKVLISSLTQVVESSPQLILESLVCSLFVGLIATALALWFCREASHSRRGQALLVAWAIVILSLPSPVLGFAVKEAIERVLDFEDWLLGDAAFRPLRLVLYDLPSPLPVIWCQTVKFLPIAIGLILPTMNRLSSGLRDELRLSGVGRWTEFRILFWPQLRGMLMVSVLVIMLFATSEIGASKLVEVPGRVTFAQELFRQMHYGSDRVVAPFCLIHVAMASLIGILLFTITRRKG